MIGRLFLTAWLTLLFAAALFGAEEPRAWPPRDAIQTWRVGSGLPHQRVQAVCQTEDGFLWIGTAQGLARFDGVDFELAPLPDNPSVVRLSAGKGNRLWVGTGDGTLWRGEGMRFEKVFQDGFPGGFEILAEDRDGRLWISSIGHFRVYLWEKGELRDMTAHWDQTGAGHVAQMRVDEQGRPIANGGGMIWTVQGETLEPVPGYKGDSIYHAPGRDHSYWVSDGSGVRRLSEGRLSPPVGPGNWGGRHLTFGIEDHDGNLWVATGGYGILCYRDQVTHRRLDTRDGLCGDFASCLYVDRQGNLWVGSDGGGLSRVTPALFGVAGRVEGLSSDRVTAIERGPDGSLWIGTHADGLNRFDGSAFSRVPGFPETTGVLSLAAEGKDLWIGHSGGLALWSEGQREGVVGWPRSGWAVEALHRDRQGGLWVGQRSAGSVICMRGRIPGEVRLRADAQTEFDVRDFAEDETGAVWIGTDGAGLFRHSEGKVDAVGSFRQVTALEVGGTGELWVAADGGLARIWQREGTWQVEPGWHAGVLRTLCADTRGGLWATDDQGLCRLDVGTSPARITRFGQADGVPGLQGAGSGHPQSVRDDAGRLWFATTAGVATVEPSGFAMESKVPPVLLEDLRVNGLPRWQRGQAGMPVFQSSDRGFEFRFTAIDLRHPEMLDFAARIDGVDAGWTDLGRTDAVFHSALPTGEHRFRLKVRDRSGAWSDEHSLAFRILPPLWQRGWFIAVVTTFGLIIAAGVAWLVARWRLQRQLTALRVERALEAERARIARDLHDHLGSGLTEIAFLGDSLRMERGDGGEAAEVSVRARELTRTMDETVWALNPENDTFEGLISYLGHAMPVWLKSSGIRCRLDFPDESLRFGLNARVRRELYLACKEAAHNAVKHSGAEAIILRVEKIERDLVITLSDDGRGFDPASVTAGNGLANLKRRLSELGGTATITSKPAAGTTVRFVLPLADSP
ncbi:ATP-binding protein [Luteolibacter arcticus]|uniref:ATP-binding protein n=1 Tax=Luteolibacter arcticus TaxID=1581411 RepID=A0ABT3GCJ0_9BACT|nr:sensor histidine kinase [Luteolibacter arcticus]MCW1921353.1 ATP-binding protein [Luteolibacter arcticus]